MIEKWDDLDEEQKRALQKPRNKLSKAQRKLRKKLFYNDYWIDSDGNKQQFQNKKNS